MGNSFPYTFESKKNYNVRGKASGYDDLIRTINISSSPVKIIIIPDKSNYYVGDVINITADPNDSRIEFDGGLVEGEITLIKGSFLIKATHDNFFTTERNLSVTELITVKATSPQEEDFKKGKSVLVELSQNTDWEVQMDGTIIKTGNGNLVEFEVDEYGVFLISCISVFNLPISPFKEAFSFAKPFI